MEQEIKKILEKAVSEIYYKSDDRTDYSITFSVEASDEEAHGDYSTNAALVLAKKVGKPPREVAEDIIGKLSSKVLENLGIRKVEVAGPGFINFFIADYVIVENLKKINKNFGEGKAFKRQKIFVEHTQPNPFKIFHIGHLMNNAIGESVARLIAKNGAKVKTASYHGDAGLHVAKAVWALRQGVALDAAYAHGHRAYEESEAAKNEILNINAKIYEKNDREVNELYTKGREESLGQFELIYRLLGSNFDYRFYESECGEIGKKIVLQNEGKIFEKGEKGAVIFRGENFEPKTHTRVFLNSEGLPTYEAKELGLAKKKRSAWNFTGSVTVTANEQDSFFKVTEVAIGEVFPDLKGKLKHLSHGMLKLPSGKMSSRTGNVITASSLIAEVESMVREKVRERDLAVSEKEEIVQKVAIGAIKYSILKQAVGSDIIYDFEKSISFEGDSGPYLQYSFARAKSILRKAGEERVKPSLKKPLPPSQLEKVLEQFPEVVEKAGKNFQPHVLALYLTGLCSAFNRYYEQNKIVDKQDEFSPYKVALVEKVSLVLENGLWLLGIEAPEKI